MAKKLDLARSEFILGGQRSGKSRRAELLAHEWLAQSPDHKAVLIATAQARDEEMKSRIARHQQDRAERVPGMTTVEEPLALAAALARASTPATLVVVDCLTLWLTNLLMPCEWSELAQKTLKTAKTDRNSDEKMPAARYPRVEAATFLIAIKEASGPVVVVGNEIGLGVIPMGRETRAFVDTLGWLNQDVASACERVTLMAAGLSLTVKGQA
jgi:adenosylcobinamide kinase/adenosylcobinamide-phosphate guanylyltransferase